MTKEQKHFQQAVYEIYTTELDFVEDLKIIIEVTAAVAACATIENTNKLKFFVAGFHERPDGTTDPQAEQHCCPLFKRRDPSRCQRSMATKKKKKKNKLKF